MRARAGNWPQSTLSTSLPVSHHAAQAPQVPMEFPSLPMPQQRQEHPPLIQPLQTLLPTCPHHLPRQAGYTARGAWLTNTFVCLVTDWQGLEPLLQRAGRPQGWLPPTATEPGFSRQHPPLLGETTKQNKPCQNNNGRKRNVCRQHGFDCLCPRAGFDAVGCGSK